MAESKAREEAIFGVISSRLDETQQQELYKWCSSFDAFMLRRLLSLSKKQPDVFQHISFDRPDFIHLSYLVAIPW